MVGNATVVDIVLVGYFASTIKTEISVRNVAVLKFVNTENRNESVLLVKEKEFVSMRKGFNVVNSSAAEVLFASTKNINTLAKNAIKLLIANMKEEKKRCIECKGQTDLSQSRGEIVYRQNVEKITGEKFKKARLDFLKWKTGRNLELDCFNEELKIAIKYNGKRHCEFVPFFHKTGKVSRVT